MKRGPLYILLLFISNLAFVSKSAAQYNAIKIDALGTLLARLNISYERSFGRHFSAGIQLEAGMHGNQTINNEEIYRLMGLGIIPEVRYYPFTKNKPAPLGFFVGGAFRYAFLEEQFLLDGIYLTGDVYNLGISTGYKFNYRKVLFEFLIGYGGGVDKGFDEEIREYLNPIYKGGYSFFIGTIKQFPRIEVSAGYVFPKVKTEKKKKIRE